MGLMWDLLTVLAPSGGRAYILRDDLTTPVAAGFTSPRSGEPSGRLYRSLDSLSRASLDSGDLLLNGAAAVTWNDPGYYWTDDAGNGFARAAGRTFIFRVSPASGQLNFGLSVSTTVSAANVVGIRFAGLSAILFINRGSGGNIGVWDTAATYFVALTERTDGLEVRIKGGVWTDWELLFCENGWTDATLYPAFGIAGTVSIRFGFVRGADSPLLAASATQSVSTPVSGTIYTAPADCDILAQFVSPAGAAGRYIEIRYRINGNNYMLVRRQWNTGTSQWDLVSGHVIAGVETLQGSPVANIGSNVTRMQVRARANLHDYWTSPTVSDWNRRYTGIVDTSGQTETGMAIVENGGFTLSSLTSWEISNAAISADLDSIIN